jgi:hypothetical protein
MNGVRYQRPWARRVGWGIVLAVIFGALIYAVLTLLTGGFLVSVSVVVAAFVLAALFHYFTWGEYMTPATPAGRPLTTQEGPAPVDEFSVAINERERAELIRALEQSHVRSATTQELLERLRGYGA